MTCEPEKGIAPDELLKHGPAVVLRAVVDDDYLEGDVGRGAKDGLRLFHEQRQILRLVLGGNEHGDVYWRE